MAKFKNGSELNQEQSTIAKLIHDNTLSVLSGKPGSGKTFLACHIALDLLDKKQVQKIIITRPTVSKEDIGFLPGTVDEKMDPWLQPIYQNMYLMYDRNVIDRWKNDGKIEIAPVSYMRGRTFLDSIIIVDEAQNLSDTQTEMIITRIGLRSKMIVTGDESQIDLKDKSDSGFAFLCNVAESIDDACYAELKTNNRHPIVEILIQKYKEHNVKKNESKEQKKKQKKEKQDSVLILS